MKSSYPMADKLDEPPFLDADGTEAYADALVNMATAAGLQIELRVLESA